MTKDWRSLQCLLGFNRLDGSVVMVLMSLLVNGSGDLFVLVGTDMLFRLGLANILVHGGRVIPVAGDEIGNCLLCFLHDD